MPLSETITGDVTPEAALTETLQARASLRSTLGTLQSVAEGDDSATYATVHLTLPNGTTLVLQEVRLDGVSNASRMTTTPDRLLASAMVPLGPAILAALSTHGGGGIVENLTTLLEDTVGTQDVRGDSGKDPGYNPLEP